MTTPKSMTTPKNTPATKTTRRRTARPPPARSREAAEAKNARTARPKSLSSARRWSREWSRAPTKPSQHRDSECSASTVPHSPIGWTRRRRIGSFPRGSAATRPATSPSKSSTGKAKRTRWRFWSTPCTSVASRSFAKATRSLPRTRKRLSVRECPEPDCFRLQSKYSRGFVR